MSPLTITILIIAVVQTGSQSPASAFTGSWYVNRYIPLSGDNGVYTCATIVNTPYNDTTLKTVISFDKNGKGQTLQRINFVDKLSDNHYLVNQYKTVNGQDSYECYYDVIYEEVLVATSNCSFNTMCVTDTKIASQQVNTRCPASKNFKAIDNSKC